MHLSSFFFFNDTATTEIYTLSLHDALSDLPAAPGGADAAPYARRRPDRGRDQEPARVDQHLHRADRRALRRSRLPQALLLGGPAGHPAAGGGLRETRGARDGG